jgi:transcriptional regulator with XRE-family HTH domain
MNTQTTIGEKLRDWRHRRHLSQLELALDADISARHLSFLETGRAAPSRDMVLHLAEQLDVPLRERNALLLAAGYAPTFSQRPLDDAGLQPALDAVNALLKAHEPFPALAIDRHWTLVAANAAVAPLLAGAAPWLTQHPVNVLRLSLHPEGLAPRIKNLGEWRAHLISRLRRQFADTADPELAAMIEEFLGYPRARTGAERHEIAAIAVPLRVDVGGETLSFLSTTMVFGTPLDVTLSELAIETFLPADSSTMAALRRSG